jgi:hypothetical protein
LVTSIIHTIKKSKSMNSEKEEEAMIVAEKKAKEEAL